MKKVNLLSYNEPTKISVKNEVLDSNGSVLRFISLKETCLRIHNLVIQDMYVAYYLDEKYFVST